MRRFYLLLFAFLVNNLGFSQKKLPDFGKIDISDLKLQSCSFEPSASAMKLFDVLETEFEPSEYTSRLTTERRVRIKIFNTKGYEHASIRIPYFSKKRVTKIKDLDGILYSLDSNGQVVIEKLSKKDFFKEKAEDNVGIINFTFPHLKPGCVIEYRYTKIEKNIFQIDPWLPQGEIPTAYASMVLTTPSFSRVKTKIYGADTIDQVLETLKRGSYIRERRTYSRENIISFEPEPFMSSYKDNLLKVVFLLIPETNFFVDVLTSPQSIWKYAGLKLMQSEDFGGQLKKKIPGTENIIDSAKKILPIENRIGFIYEKVKKRMSDKSEQTLYPSDLTEAWNNRTGNTAEINLILLNLLQKADVISVPLLISTRENGKVNKDFPSIGQLNGVDVLAADSTKYFLLDASLKYQSYLNPPFNILNREGFLLQEDNMQWVSIADSRPLLKQITDIVARIKEDGIIEGNAVNSFYDYAKSYMLDSTTEQDPEDRFTDKKPLGLKIVSVSQENTENDDEPLLQKIEFTYEPQNTGDYYFINPQILTSKKESPFIKQGRATDIDFGCNQQYNLILRLEIPPGFTVDFLPKNITVRAPDSSFFFRRSFSSDSDYVFFSQTFEIKQPVFFKEDYPAIQEFFNRVYHLMSEEIVLKRKK